MYILNKFPAKIPASSPPVPARISSIAFLLSSGSFGRSNTFISFSIGATFPSNSSNSIFAISRSSSSFSLAIISLAVSILLNISLNSLYVSTRGSKSRYSLLSFTYRFISEIISGSVINWPTSSNRILIPPSLSNIILLLISFYFIKSVQN